MGNNSSKIVFETNSNESMFEIFTAKSTYYSSEEIEGTINVKIFGEINFKEIKIYLIKREQNLKEKLIIEQIIPNQ